MVPLFRIFTSGLVRISLLSESEARLQGAFQLSFLFSVQMERSMTPPSWIEEFITPLASVLIMCAHNLVHWSPHILYIQSVNFASTLKSLVFDWISENVFPFQVRQFSTATRLFKYPKICQPEHSGLSCQNPHTDCLLQSLVHKLLWIMFPNTMNPTAQLAWGQHCWLEISSSGDYRY